MPKRVHRCCRKQFRPGESECETDREKERDVVSLGHAGEKMRCSKSRFSRAACREPKSSKAQGSEGITFEIAVLRCAGNAENAKQPRRADGFLIFLKRQNVSRQNEVESLRVSQPRVSNTLAPLVSFF